MYEEYLSAVLNYVHALNEADKANAAMKANPDLVPYVQFIPVLLGGDLCGFLTDEIGGSYQYADVTDVQREWWKSRPGVNDA